MFSTTDLLAVGGFFLSLAILVGGVLLYAWRRGSSHKTSWPQPWHLLCVCIFAAIFVFVLSQTLCGVSPSETPVLGSLFSTIQMFLLEKDMDVDPQALGTALTGWSQPYLAYNAFLYLLAPLTTAGAVLLLVSRFASLPLLWLRSRSREVFLFSGLTRDSLELANSTAAHDRSSVVAFADVDSCDDEELVADARESGYLCLSKDVTSLVTWCHVGSCVHVVMSSDDETANVHQTLAFVRHMCAETRHGKSMTLHVMARNGAVQGFIDTASQLLGEASVIMPVRRIDATADLVRQLLMSNPLFLLGSGDEDPSGPYQRARRRIAILGHDDLCYEFLKAALWCGRMEESDMQIEVADPRAHELSQRLAFECPEIYRLIGSEYHVSFRQMALESHEFVDFLLMCEPGVSYVLVSQESDLESVRIARRVREITERGCIDPTLPESPIPRILVHAEDPVLAQTLANAKSPKGQPYGLVATGSRDVLLSYENTFHPSLERWARNLNRAYWGFFDMPDGPEREELGRMADASYELSEYNRNSSMASAIFLKYDLYSFGCKLAHREIAVDGLPGCDASMLPTSEDWLLPLDAPALQPLIDAYAAYVHTQDVEWLQRLEHDRWSAYVRTLGFECASEQAYRSFYPMTGKDQDQLARLHVCLVPYDDLDQVDEMVQRVEGAPRSMSFKDVDKVVISHLAEIVRTA